MNKTDFLYSLRMKLSQLPHDEVEKHISYYEEMIADRMEDGMTEYEAVASLEDVSVIAERILQDTPITTLMKTKVKPKNGWTTAAVIAAIIGSPIWIALLIALAVVVIAVVATLWGAAIAVIAVVAAIVLTGILLLIAPFFMIGSGLPVMLMCFAGGLGIIGIALLGFVGVKYLVKGIAALCRAIGRGVKSIFIRKEN
ncbi:MAG: DUF1700 domain-containing protein [Oscillospiraceae bacterium]|nr:DUF1700 domain-containing protein [Oscillospiraceae bacterium]